MGTRLAWLVFVVAALAAFVSGCGGTADDGRYEPEPLILTPVPTTTHTHLPEIEVPIEALEYLFREHQQVAVDLINGGLVSLLNTDPYLPEHVLDYLYRQAHKDGYDFRNIIDDILEHPNVPEYVVSDVALGITDYPRGDAARLALVHPRLPTDVIIHLLKQDTTIDEYRYRVEVLLSERDDLPEAEVQQLSKTDPSEHVRELATERLWQIVRDN